MSIDRSATDPGRAAPSYHENAVGEEHRLAQIVRHQHDRDPARRGEVADHAPQLLARDMPSSALKRLLSSVSSFGSWMSAGHSEAAQLTFAGYSIMGYLSPLVAQAETRK